MSYDPEYYRPENGVPEAPFQEPLSQTFMDPVGRNRIRVPFQAVPGNPNTPAIFHQGDEKSGWFSDGVARLGSALFGQRRYVQTDAGVEYWDKHGLLWGISNPGDYLAIADGSIPAGAAVATVPGVLSVPTVAVASPGGPEAIGMAVAAAADGDLVQVRTVGVLALDDWTELTGSPTLTEMLYCLATNGLLQTTFGTQLICTRLGPKTVAVLCRSEYDPNFEISKTNESGSSIAAGKAVALNGTGCVLARADAYTTRAFGIAVSLAANGAGTRIKTMGTVTLADWTNATGSALLVEEEDYFLHASTGGLLTTLPADISGCLWQRVARAVSANTLSVQVNRDPIML